MNPLLEDAVGQLRTVAGARWPSASRLRAGTRAALTRHRQSRQAMARAVRAALQRRRSAALVSLRAALHQAPPQVWDVSAPPDARAAGEARLQDEVLRVIEDHPDGIGAVDVGNELGVDWRRVLGVGRTLAEGGLVDQVGHDFFPARHEVRRW